MENIPVPPPNPPPTGWRPTNSTNVALVAGAAVQFISAAVEQFTGWKMDAMTQGSLTVLVMYASSYLHPDGGRK
jgi:hypothetical protein